MKQYLIERNDEIDLKFNGKRLASVTKYSIFGKKTEYVLYETAGGNFICKQTEMSIISVNRFAVAAYSHMDVQRFFGAEIAGKLFKEAGIKLYMWVN